jgi:DNA replication and repair protein RecF
MMIQSLYLRQFRNFSECAIGFGSGLNVIRGMNGQGKTNLLEALSLLSMGRSFRTHHLAEMIQEGASFFFLEARLQRDGIEQVVRISYDGRERGVECNATRHTSFQPLLGMMPGIFFTPQDADLIGGAPAIRRRFLNLHLAQSDPLYVHHLLRFLRAVKQRNALLRAASCEGIEYWEEEMARSANYLTERRRIFLTQLNGELSQGPPLIMGSVEVRYEPSQADSYLEQLRKQRPREKAMGTTLIGPHRDDFSLLLREKPACLHASEGQRRAIGALLRLAEWKRLKEETGLFPFFVIDDFEMHLDPERQEMMRKTLPSLGQVFITTPQANDVWTTSHMLHIAAGHLSPFHLKSTQKD